jgi:PAS domain S-box-containing protein
LKEKIREMEIKSEEREMQVSDRNRSEKLFYISVITAITIGLYLSSFYSYLLFHNLIEIITIAVAFALFSLTWNARGYLVNGYLKLLGIGYAFIALIDLLHTLTYKGMDVFPGYDANLPTQLWIAARFLQAVTLSAAPLLVGRKVDDRAIFGGYAAVVSVLVAVVFSGHFPDCYIEGKGLTTFKISSEYVISVLLLASLYLFYKNWKYFDEKVFFLAASSIAFTIVSEISFTAYVSVYGFANLVGHFAKLVAFYLIYRAILVTGLKKPFDLIFRDLKQAEKALRTSQDTLEEKVRERTAELHTSEERYRSLIQKVQTAIILHDGQGRILISNPLAQELLGLSANQLLGKALVDPEWHFLREDGSVLPVAEYPVNLVLSSRQPLRGQVTGINRPERGDITWVLVNADPEFDNAGQIALVIVSFVDITEHKQANEALQRLNRELRTISHCNQLLVRVEDEQTLLNDICRIICDEAGYRMAWVGYAENDNAKTIRPVARAGVEDGYIEEAWLTWADTERGRGQSGTAIRSGEIVCIQDHATEPRVALWRDKALQRGYRSSIALPLNAEGGNTFGILNIYSTEPNAFTSDEIRILEELASDLAFGVTTVRSRTDRKLAERALEESEAKTRNILDNIGIGVSLISPRMEILELNRQMRKWFPGVDPGQHPVCYRAFNDPPREAICDYCPTCKTLQDGLVHEATTQTPQKGVIRNYRIISSPILNASGEVTAAIEMVDDITERLTLESQFRQAQKMESVGRLAGGVAHDFNNMLGVILGRTEMAMDEADPAQPFFSDLQEIRKAAERSANLTRQLLAFARKQTIAPRVLDLNETVESMLKMLRHLIGEDINLAWLPGKNLWPVHVDPSQIDQILANLCVNARDAIAGVGKITIETEPTAFDEIYSAMHAECVPGEYVLLAVSDNGCGMSREIRDKLFEPFFTTKEMGKGTGLGLATVYGIVKQNNGFINVFSEPGQGTTFKIYLPRHKGTAEQIRQEGPAEPPRGHETILLVEDEPAMLNLITLMLQRLGYTVLAASTPGEAIRLAESHAGEIHLLMTDVVMPEMNGRDLAKNLLSLYPHLKPLFMSGYAANVIVHHGMLDEGVHYIQKPFSKQALAAKVREALDSQ